MLRSKDSEGVEGLSKEEAEKFMELLNRTTKQEAEYPVVFDHIEALHSEFGRRQILELLAKKELINAFVPRGFCTVVKHYEKGFTFFRELVKSCSLEYVIQVIQAGLEIENSFLLHTSYLIGTAENAETVMFYLLKHFPFSQESLKRALTSVCCRESPRKLELLDFLILLIKDINEYGYSDPVRVMIAEDALDPKVIDMLMKAGFDMQRDVVNSSGKKIRRIDLITRKINPVVMRDICTLLIAEGLE